MVRTHLTEPTYLFVDAQHLRQYYNEFAALWFGEEAQINFRGLMIAANAFRLFYYDSLDDMPRPKESQDEFSRRVKARQGEHTLIRAVEGAHVKLGTVVGEKRRQQKQVDILLAVDMMNHAVRQNMKKAILLTGDQDFKPVVDSLVLLGTFIEVWGDKKHTSAALIDSADSYRRLTALVYHELSPDELRKKYPLPSYRTIAYKDGYYEGQLRARGRSGDVNFIQTILGSEWAVFAIDTPQGASVYTFRDEGRLKLYVEMIYGPIEWEPVK